MILARDAAQIWVICGGSGGYLSGVYLIEDKLREFAKDAPSSRPRTMTDDPRVPGASVLANPAREEGSDDG